MKRLRFSCWMLALTLAGSACGPAGLTEGEGFIDVTGGRVWYRVVGSGTQTPLLVLHGGPGVGSVYLKPLAMLADDRPVVFYDQLSSGKSDKPADSTLWTIERYAREVDEVREALGLDRIHLLGHSWGTMLAMEYMQNDPEGVESLIMSSPLVSTAKWMEDANRYRAELPDSIQTILVQHEEAGTTDSDEYLAAADVYMGRHVFRFDTPPIEIDSAMAGFGMGVYQYMWGPSEFYASGTLKDFDRLEYLDDLALPTLFTAGRYDEASPETVEWYSSFVPGARLVIFEQSAHMAMLKEPEEFVGAIREFLRDVEVR